MPTLSGQRVRRPGAAPLAGREGHGTTPAAPHPLERVFGLQQALWNQAMQERASACPALRLCPTGGACHACPFRAQAKMTMSQPGDKYEQEADRVAEQVMRMPGPPTPVAAAGASHTLQRRCSGCDEDELRRQPEEEKEEEEETLAAKAVAGRTPEVTPDVQAEINAMGGGGQPLNSRQDACCTSPSMPRSQGSRRTSIPAGMVTQAPRQDIRERAPIRC